MKQSKRRPRKTMVCATYRTRSFKSMDSAIAMAWRMSLPFAGRLFQLGFDHRANRIQVERAIVSLAIDKYRGRALHSRAVAVVSIVCNHGPDVRGIEIRREARDVQSNPSGHRQ